MAKLANVHADRSDEFDQGVGAYSMDPSMQANIDNMWAQFNQNLGQQVYSPINAALGGAGRTGSGIHGRMLTEGGNRAFLGVQGQEQQLRMGDYQQFMQRKNQLIQAGMSEDAALRHAMAGIRQARIGANAQITSAGIMAKPSLINAQMAAGNQMDQSMNPYAQGLGYLGDYNNVAGGYQGNTGYVQSPYLGAVQGASGAAQSYYGAQGVMQ